MLVDHAPPCEVDEERRGLHRSKDLGVDKMFGVLIERKNEDEEVDLSRDLE
jgi:hypothetical protein